MSIFEYVSVMVGVVLALAVSHILTFVATLIAHPERAKKDWLYFIWVLLIFALNVNAWLLLWTMHGQSEFPVWKLLTMLFTSVLIFVVSRVLIPELLHNEQFDLRAHLLQVRVPFFTALTLICFVPVLRGLIVEGLPLFDPLNLLKILMLALALSGVFVNRPAWLWWLALLWGMPLVGGLLFLWGPLQ